ncbi:DNA repair protein RadC [Bordetella sp. LUAb4]|uniref:RadC family protein n=1 Tax=Bordetella sp. LUAb4 TaxID=2843195 RepID=UPI001E4261A6|nr:DNA repair protein RadC [Bordetella sp. LUAb4]
MSPVPAPDASPAPIAAHALPSAEDPAPRHPDISPDKPRERLLRDGPTALSDAELLAVVLCTGLPGRPVLALARQIIDHYGGLRGLLAATPDTLRATPGLGTAKTCQVLSVLELAHRAIHEELAHGRVLDQPDRVKQYCLSLLGHRKVEHCLALYLDSGLRLIATGEVARGTLNKAAVYPREIVRDALRHHAAALILTHNHPSGRAEPSESDLRLTRHVRRALALVEIHLLDHLIVAGATVMSLAEHGKLG